MTKFVVYLTIAIKLGVLSPSGSFASEIPKLLAPIASTLTEPSKPSIVTTPSDLNSDLNTEEASKKTTALASPVVTVEKTEFISTLDQSVDENFQRCVLEESTGRASNVSLIVLFKTRTQARLDNYLDFLEKNPNTSESTLIARLEKIHDEILEESIRLQRQTQGSDLVKNIAKAEMERIAAEANAKMMVMLSSIGSSDQIRDRISMFYARADTAIDRGKKLLHNMNPAAREILSPRLIARMAFTDLSIQELSNMRFKNFSDTQKFDSYKKVVDEYKSMPLHENEKAWLSVAFTDAFQSLGDGDNKMGASAHRPYMDDSRFKIIEKEINYLNSVSDKISNHELKAKVEETLWETPFYYLNESESKEHRHELNQALKSKDPQEQANASRALESLIERNITTSLGYDLSSLALSHDPSNEKYRAYKNEILQYDQEVSDNLKSIIGEESYKKFDFLTHEEIMKSKGALKQHQDRYLALLTNLAKAQQNLELKASDENIKAFQKTVEDIDLQWVRIQCHKQALNLPSSDSQKALVSPLGNYKLNYLANRCQLYGRRGYSFQEIDELANGFTRDAIDSSRDKALMKLGGEFALDVATTLVSGGITSVVKLGVKKTFASKAAKKFAKQAIRKKHVTAGFVRGSGRVGSFAADTIAVDLTNQSVKATRHFITEGVSGNWDTKNLSNSFSYSNDEIRNDQHVTRLFVSGTISKGLESIWGRSRVVSALGNRIKTQQNQMTQITNRLGLESTKSTVNTMTSSQIVPAIDGLLGYKEYNFGENALKFVDAGVWAQTFFDSLRSNSGKAISGGKASSVSARYLGNIFETVTELGLTEEDVKQFEKLEKCYLSPEASEKETLIEETKIGSRASEETSSAPLITHGTPTTQ